MPGLLDMLNSPQTAMAAGLLAPTQGGSFGGGLLQGIGAGNAQQQAMQQQQLFQQQQEEQRRLQESRQGITGLDQESVIRSLQAGDIQGANAQISLMNAIQTNEVNPTAASLAMAACKDSPNPAQCALDKLAAQKAAGAQKLDLRINTEGELANVTEKKAGEKVGTGIGENVNKRRKEAHEAMAQNARLDRALLSMARGADTGFGAEQILDFKSLLVTLGKEPDNVEKMGEEEVLRGIGSELALRMRNPEGGLGLTGNTSNRDLQFLKSAVVGLNRTEEGNILLIEMMQRLNQLKLELNAEQDRIIAANNGRIPFNIESQLMDFVNEQEFLSDDERDEIEKLKNRKKTSPRKVKSSGKVKPRSENELEDRYGTGK